MTITIDEKIACAEREIKYRKRVYPNWIEAGRMTRALGNHQIAAMEAVAATLRTAKKTFAADELELG